MPTLAGYIDILYLRSGLRQRQLPSRGNTDLRSGLRQRQPPSRKSTDTVQEKRRQATLVQFGRAGPSAATRKRDMQTHFAVDSPRAWVVVAACLWINLFSLAMVRSGAIIYVGIAQTFMVSREEASWPLCLTTLFHLAAGKLTGKHFFRAFFRPLFYRARFRKRSYGKRWTIKKAILVVVSLFFYLYVC